VATTATPGAKWFQRPHPLRPSSLRARPPAAQLALTRAHTTAKIRTNETALGKLKGMDLPTSDLFNRGGVARIVFEHGRPDEVFFVGHGGRHWATLDKGDSYVQPCGLETHGDLCLQHPAPGQTLSPPFVKYATPAPPRPNHRCCLSPTS